MKQPTLFLLWFALPLLIILSASFGGGNPIWKAPASADTLKNPYKGTEATAAVNGKKNFARYCIACHGSGGKGDGIASASLNPRPADFLNTSIQDETDGALFWKMTNGKAPMPTFSKKLTNEQRWELVCYIRVLQKKVTMN